MLNAAPLHRIYVRRGPLSVKPADQVELRRIPRAWPLASANLPSRTLTSISRADSILANADSSILAGQNGLAFQHWRKLGGSRDRLISDFALVQ